MLVHNNVNQSSPNSERQTGSTLGSREIAIQRTSSQANARVPTPLRSTPTRRRRRILGIMSALLLIILILAAVRLAAVASASNDELLVRVGNQQVITLDLRQSLPISPDLLGTNVFPQSGTRSADNAQGFMDYSPPLIAGLTHAHIKLLRFPGGKWGEDHYLSLDQLSAFSTLLQETHADGMVQARLSGPIQGTDLTDVASRAAVAARWVDFLNNPRSDQRIGKYVHTPYHPVKYWTVGDEPDTLINPATRQKYLVRDYVHDFIQFSTVMHKIDPHIQVFGPDISEFYAPGAGPSDAKGQLWMEGFLQGIGAYERAHNVVLLDGISFHRYQFIDAAQGPYVLLSSTGAWNYLLPALHELIGQDLKRDVPIAVTEINTSSAPIPGQPQRPPLLYARGVAALWWADTLGTLMNSQVEYIAFAPSADVNTPYPLFTTAGQQPASMWRVMELFSHLQRNLIPLEVQRDPLSVYATQDTTHQAVSLLFINKSSTSQLAQISGVKNSFGISSWNSLDVSLAGYAMVVVTLHRTGNAEAYSFIASASTDSTTAPVIHSLCGNKTDPLATTTPC